MRPQIRSFELSSELTLLYLQRTSSARAGPTLETALQRVPILHIRAGRLHAAIDRCRFLLRPSLLDTFLCDFSNTTFYRFVFEWLVVNGSRAVYILRKH